MTVTARKFLPALPLQSVSPLPFLHYAAINFDVSDLLDMVARVTTQMGL